jgi:tritrans,polycis-undecaprenyl-diphosphate synthase [geranylgeranyl-diphosphate specific]
MLESIAFIPDGNRRYAKKTGISLAQSYALGTERAWDVLNWLSKYPTITTGTFYTFSIKNFERSKEELGILMNLFEKQLIRVLNEKIDGTKDGVQIKFIGQTNLFPANLQEEMQKVEEKTSVFSGRVLNLALGYDGQTEIVDAAKKFATDARLGKIDPSSLTSASFNKYLYSDFKAPDLIVRTSNEQRLSGFLTYQSSYSELAFIDKYWPELTEKDVDKVVLDFEERERRFGK